MHRFGQLPMMHGGPLCSAEARLHATTALPGGGEAPRLRTAGPSGELLPGHADGIRRITTARESRDHFPGPAQRRGAKGRQVHAGSSRQAGCGGTGQGRGRRSRRGTSLGARRGELGAERGLAGAARPGDPLPASRRAAPSSTVPESSWRGMVLPAGTQGFFPADGGEAGAEALAGLRRALLGPGRFPRWRR